MIAFMCVCVCGCVYVHHYIVLNVLGFDPKIRQTLTEAHTDQDSPGENKMEMKENVFVCHISLSTRENLSHIKHSAANVYVCCANTSVFHHRWVPLFDEGVI